MPNPNPLQDLVTKLKQEMEQELEDEGEGPPLTPLSQESLVKLADVHILMFQRRIASNHPNVNQAECQRYLAIWQSVREKTYDALTPPERGEVTDARVDRGYDHLLLPEERLP